MGRMRRRTADRWRRLSADPAVPAALVQGPPSPATAATDNDRLSSLSDDLLLSIIRRLPIREVVRMSVLSREWRRLPSLLPVLDEVTLDVDKAYEGGGCGWSEEVDKALSGHWGLIRRFRVSTRLAPRDGRWVEAVGGAGVRWLDLDASFCNNRRFDAGPVLRHCRSLTHLALNGCFFAVDASAASVQCTDLRKLRLDGVEISDDLFEHLISTCASLERLEMWGCTGLGSIRIKAAPCLRRVELGSVVMPDKAVECITFDVDTSNLEDLEIQVTNWWFEEFTIHAPNLTSLSVFVEDVIKEPLQGCGWVVSQGLTTLLNSATKLRSLKLNSASTQCLRPPDVLPESSCPCRFPSLTTLTMDVSFKDYQQVSCLALLLQGCPRLEKLDVTSLERESPHDVGLLRSALMFWEHEKINLDKMGCLHHLRDVTMSRLTGGICEMNLAYFFLKEAATLEKLTLRFRKKFKKSMEIVSKHLPELRRRSLVAKLQVRVHVRA